MTDLPNDTATNSPSERTRAALRGAPALGSLVLPPLAGIVELIVLTGFIITIDVMLPDVDLADIQPNPFWLPVLLLSLQYGTVSGLLAAGTALLVTVLSGLPEAGVGENHFSYALRVFSQPILWFGAAVLLGQFRMRQIVAKEGLRDMVIDLEQQRGALTGYAQGLRQRCAVLERDRAAMGEAPGVTLLARLADVRAGSGDLGPDLARLVVAALPGSKVSAMALGPTALTQIAAVDWAADAPWARELTIAHPLYRAVVGEGRTVSMLASADEHRLAGEGLVAVPIRDAGGAVCGMLKLEAADPSTLSPSTVAALDVIASALSGRLTRTASAQTGNRPAAAQLSSGVDDVSAPRHVRSIAWRRGSEPAASGPAGPVGDTTATGAAAVMLTADRSEGQP